MDSEKNIDVPSCQDEDDIEEIDFEQFEPGNEKFVEISCHQTDSKYWIEGYKYSTPDETANFSGSDVVSTFSLKILF